MDSPTIPICAVVIDDEPNVRAVVRAQVRRNFADTIHIVGEASGVEEGILRIRETTPNLVFLDVDLGDGSGFDVLDALSNERLSEQFYVIFITSFPDFAVRAIRYDAVDFLTKPFISADFRIAVERVLAKMHRETKAHSAVSPEPATTGIAAGIPADTLVIHQAHDALLIPIEHIEYCEANRGYTRFMLLSGASETASKTLLHYEAILIQYGFVRISRSHCVNSRYIRRIIKRTSERMMELVMQSGAILRPTPDYQEAILKLLQQRGVS